MQLGAGRQFDAVDAAGDLYVTDLNQIPLPTGQRASRRSLINPSFSRQAERRTLCLNSLDDTETQRAPRLRLPQCSRRRAMR
jgi:hypothetical protein